MQFCSFIYLHVASLCRLNFKCFMHFLRESRQTGLKIYVNLVWNFHRSQLYSLGKSIKTLVQFSFAIVKVNLRHVLQNYLRCIKRFIQMKSSYHGELFGFDSLVNINWFNLNLEPNSIAWKQIKFNSVTKEISLWNANQDQSKLTFRKENLSLLSCFLDFCLLKVSKKKLFIFLKKWPNSLLSREN